MKKMVSNQNGLSLISVIITIAIIAMVAVAGLAAASYMKKDADSGEIEGNKGSLQSSAKAYYTNHTDYPTKPAITFDDSKMDTYLSNFFKQIAYFSGITTKSLYEGKNKEYQADYDAGYLIDGSSTEKQNIDKIVMSKVLNMDIEGMVANSYMSKAPKNPDNYFIHTTTGFVYYVDESMSLEEISNEAKRLVTDSGGITDLTSLGSIELTKDGKKMDKIISSVTNGSVVIYGGAGSMVLAKVKIAKDDTGQAAYEITDLSSTLLGTGTTDGVTELRLMENNKVLAHYFDNTTNKMMYRTIGID